LFVFLLPGTEKFYRNNAEDVAYLLNQQHRGCWRIFNVSETDYRYYCFPSENVKFFGWLDHYAPPMVCACIPFGRSQLGTAGGCGAGDGRVVVT
jgi:hypothetical protein